MNVTQNITIKIDNADRQVQDHVQKQTVSTTTSTTDDGPGNSATSKPVKDVK
jgi:hypothetical protein